jgi:hypothetical protein
MSYKIHTAFIINFNKWPFQRLDLPDDLFRL